MAEGNRWVVGSFAVLVAAALAAVAWLVLTPGPAREPAPAAQEKPPVRPTRKQPEQAPRNQPVRREGGKDGAKPTVVFEIQGEVQGPDGAPVPGAEILVLAGVGRDAVQAPPADAPSPEKVAHEVLRELFGMEPEEAERAVVYSGIPALLGDAPQTREVKPGASGEDGKFRIRTPGRGPYRLEARREGVGEAVASDVVAGGPAVVLKLGPAAALAGRVVSGTGAVPVEGAVLIFRSGRVLKGATSRADGSFTVPDLPPGKYSLTAGAAGFAPVTLTSVEAPSAVPVDVVLGPGFTARITVTKREMPVPGVRRGPGNALPPGPPIEGATVVVYHRQTDTYRSGVTGSDGVVRIERLGAGTWGVGARKEGYTVGSAQLRFLVSGAPEESREVRLFPSVETPLRVMDESGAPVRNARVFTGGIDEDFDERHSKLVGRTDEEGRIPFAFDDMVSWKSVVWVVPEDGGAAVKVSPEEPGSGKEEKVVVRPGRAVQGTVTDSKGKPLAGAQVFIEITDDERDIDAGLNVYTDAQGNYRFPSVPWGEATLEVDAEGEWDTIDIDADNKENPLVRNFRIQADEE